MISSQDNLMILLRIAAEIPTDTKKLIVQNGCLDNSLTLLSNTQVKGLELNDVVFSANSFEVLFGQFPSRRYQARKGRARFYQV